MVGHLEIVLVVPNFMDHLVGLIDHNNLIVDPCNVDLALNFLDSVSDNNLDNLDFSSVLDAFEKVLELISLMLELDEKILFVALWVFYLTCKGRITLRIEAEVLEV